MARPLATQQSTWSNRVYTVTIGSPLWGCGYSFTHKRRIDAFRRAVAAVERIPDATLRPTTAELWGGYNSLAQWARHTPSPRMSHQDGGRRWYLEITRI